MPRPSMEVLFTKPLEALKLSQKAGIKVEEAIRRGAFRVERGAKRRAPVNYGILRGAVQAVRTATSLGFSLWTIGTRGLVYAKFIEFGTGPAGRESSAKIGALAREAMQDLGYAHGSGGKPAPVNEVALWAKRRGIPDDLVWPIARAIGRRGVKAQPFLFPAFEAERPKIIKEVGAAVRAVFGI